jgi:hypothetical protein
MTDSNLVSEFSDFPLSHAEIILSLIVPPPPIAALMVLTVILLIF